MAASNSFTFVQCLQAHTMPAPIAPVGCLTQPQYNKPPKSQIAHFISFPNSHILKIYDAKRQKCQPALGWRAASSGPKNNKAFNTELLGRIIHN
jgi:hypothetical protein